MPTFAEVIPQVRPILAPGTLRTYNAGLTRLERTWGERRLDEPTKADFEEMARDIQAGARVNRASRGGSSAVEHFISAARCVYRYAEDKGWIRRADNPARCLAMPTRRPSHRYAITYRTFWLRELPRATPERRRLTVPVRMLFGADDSAIHPDLAAADTARADNYTIELVSDSGHFVVEERPDLARARLLTLAAENPG
ncbi:hypothetical protein [Nocardia brasiliensis]